MEDIDKDGKFNIVIWTVLKKILAKEVAQYLLSVPQDDNGPSDNASSSMLEDIIVHSSSPPTSPILESNPRSGWRHTPPDCTCRCPKKAYVVFHGQKTGIFHTW